MDVQLSAGAICAICRGERPESPVLQVLGVSSGHLPFLQEHQFGLSDGLHFSLAVLDGRLQGCPVEPGCVVRLKEFSHEARPGSDDRWFTVSDLDIVTGPQELIGNPRSVLSEAAPAESPTTDPPPIENLPLSAGWIQLAVLGNAQCRSMTPDIQLIDVTKLTNMDVRYKLTFSDGLHFMHGAASSALVAAIEKGEVQNLCILRLKTFALATIQRRRVLVVEKARVLCGPRPQVIGNPLCAEMEFAVALATETPGTVFTSVAEAQAEKHEVKVVEAADGTDPPEAVTTMNVGDTIGKVAEDDPESIADALPGWQMELIEALNRDTSASKTARLLRDMINKLRCEPVFLLGQRGGIAGVLRAMKAHLASVAVQEPGCLNLCIFAEDGLDEDGRELLVRSGGIQVILAVLNAHRGAAVVQKLACRCLGMAAEEAEDAAVIVKSGGLESVVQAMQVHSVLADVQSSALKALQQIVRHAAEGYTVAATEAGGLKAVLQALKSFRTHEKIQEAGCQVLSSFARTEYGRSAVLEQGGIRAILLAMKAQQESANVQRAACSCFASLAESDMCSAKVVELGGLESIARAMRRHDQFLLQLTAFPAVEGLLKLASNVTNAARLSGSGLVPVVVQTMRNGAQLEDVLAGDVLLGMGIRVLARICLTESGLEIGGVDFVGVVEVARLAMGRCVNNLKAEEQHANAAALIAMLLDARTSWAIEARSVAAANGGTAIYENVLNTFTTSVRVQSHCCSILAVLAENGLYRFPWSTVLGVLRAMDCQPTSVALQTNACRALGTAVAFQYEVKADTVKQAIMRVVRAMEANMSNVGLQSAALSVLCNFLGYDAYTATEIKVVVDSMQAHLLDPVVQQLGASVILRVADRHTSVEAIVAVLRAMQEHLSCEAVQGSCCAALSAMAGEMPAAVAACGGIEGVLAAMRAHPSFANLQGIAVYCLKALLDAAPERRSRAAKLGAADLVRQACGRHGQSDLELSETGPTVIALLHLPAESSLTSADVSARLHVGVSLSASPHEMVDRSSAGGLLPSASPNDNALLALTASDSTPVCGEFASGSDEPFLDPADLLDLFRQEEEFLEVQNGELKVQREAISGTSAELERLSRELAHRQKQIDSLSAALSAKERDARLTQAANAKVEADIATIRTEMSDLRGKLSSSTQLLGAKSKEAKALVAENAALKAANAAIKNDLERSRDVTVHLSKERADFAAALSQREATVSALTTKLELATRPPGPAYLLKSSCQVSAAQLTDVRQDDLDAAGEGLLALGMRVQAEQKRRQQISVDNKCVVCLANDQAVIVVPCAHLCLCRECMPRIQTTGKCPYCRQPFKDLMVVYRA